MSVTGIGSTRMDFEARHLPDSMVRASVHYYNTEQVCCATACNLIWGLLQHGNLQPGADMVLLDGAAMQDIAALVQAVAQLATGLQVARNSALGLLLGGGMWGSRS